MTGPRHAHRLPFFCLWTAALLLGCCATAPTTAEGYEDYPDLHAAMEHVVSPFAEGLLDDQIRKKGADAIDYAAVEAGARRAGYYLRCAADPGHRYYPKKQVERDGAAAARDWFAAIASASAGRRRDELLRLYDQRQTICSACHEF